MDMALVKYDDFYFKSDIEVVHRPTGSNISTNRYPNPDDACSTITVNFVPNNSEYDRMEIVRAAYELLRQRPVALDVGHLQRKGKHPVVECLWTFMSSHRQEAEDELDRHPG